MHTCMFSCVPRTYPLEFGKALAAASLASNLSNLTLPTINDEDMLSISHSLLARVVLFSCFCRRPTAGTARLTASSLNRISMPPVTIG